jgi:hypothetical protein
VLADLAIRFLAGGIIVSAFAVLGDVLKPRSFAGLFAAAPAVAIVTLALAFFGEGAAHAAIEARSMMTGAVALFAYSLLVRRLVATAPEHTVVVTVAAWAAWLVVALGLWWGLLR